MVVPAETAFKSTVPAEHKPTGTDVSVGANGPMPATVTNTGVRVDKHPETPAHDNVNEPSPDLTPLVVLAPVILPR